MASEKNYTEEVTTANPLSHTHTASSHGLHHDHIAQEALGGHTADLGKSYFRSMNFIGTVIATCLAQISGYLGWVLPANTLSLINAAIGPSTNIIWVGISWTAGFAIGFTLVGRLSDIFGRRWFFIAASILGLIGNIIGASAQSINMLIATNSINGLAAAGQLSFHIILGELVPNSLRGPVNAFVLSTSVPFAVFGPPVARSLYQTTALQWRWCYILGCIVNTFAITLYFFFYHPPTYEMLHVGGKSKLKQLKTLDWLGIFLFSTGLVVFLIGLNWGGSAYPWKSGHVLGALIGGFATLVIFCFWEAYSGLEYPLIPMRLFKNIAYDANVACASLAAIVYYANSIIWPTMVSSLFTTNITEIGWLSCAVGGGLLLGQILGGAGVRFLPKMKYQMTVAGILTTAFVAAVAASTPNTRNQTTALLLLGTIAAGYIENLTLSSTAYLWDPADMGLVTGVMGAIRTGLSAIATSMYSSILSTEAAKYIPQKVMPAALAAGLPAASLPALFTGITLRNFTSVPDISPEIIATTSDAVKEAYSLAFRTVYLCTLPFGVLLIIAAMFSPNVEQYLTDEVARKMHGKSEKTEVTRKEVVEDV
ncbi:fungal trichothecene efflux pump [Cucurbitaria berberidis CBS 394.84]|uniref:Fungal trichothecene efflux pump n=1 Tax=Cucurbitaria berberidis CBS 394.84 TaxID=1168544 RepID=A0A9P4GIK2_9PLEO|nr:fungal trichothecene efflux pump [Cucurbitaria berberidis CBS 394.84]KAF1846076.1 fungal trichothecene efflux pump [Cucurbitaria berberidis CBS 394.84]